MEFLDIITAMGESILYAYDYWVILLVGLSRIQIANVLIYVAGILWGVELIPQLIKTYKTKDVRGVSLEFFSMCLIAYSLYAIGNYLLENWSIMIAHIPSLVLNLWMVILIIIYKGKKK